jgi:hypothetical protein
VVKDQTPVTHSLTTASLNSGSAVFHQKFSNFPIFWRSTRYSLIDRRGAKLSKQSQTSYFFGLTISLPGSDQSIPSLINLISTFSSFCSTSPCFQYWPQKVIWQYFLLKQHNKTRLRMTFVGQNWVTDPNAGGSLPQRSL